VVWQIPDCAVLAYHCSTRLQESCCDMLFARDLLERVAPNSLCDPMTKWPGFWDQIPYAQPRCGSIPLSELKWSVFVGHAVSTCDALETGYYFPARPLALLKGASDRNPKYIVTEVQCSFPLGFVSHIHEPVRHFVRTTQGIQTLRARPS